MRALSIHQAAPERAQWELADGPARNIAAELPEDIAALCAQALWVRSWWAAHEHTIEALMPAAARRVQSHIVMGAAAARTTARKLGIDLGEQYMRSFRWDGAGDAAPRSQARKGGGI
jgi:hypothetical protein